MVKTKITALYERLSHEDEQAGESNSISKEQCKNNVTNPSKDDTIRKYQEIRT